MRHVVLRCQGGLVRAAAVAVAASAAHGCSCAPESPGHGTSSQSSARICSISRPSETSRMERVCALLGSGDADLQLPSRLPPSGAAAAALSKAAREAAMSPCLLVTPATAGRGGPAAGQPDVIASALRKAAAAEVLAVAVDALEEAAAPAEERAGPHQSLLRRERVSAALRGASLLPSPVSASRRAEARESGRMPRSATASSSHTAAELADFALSVAPSEPWGQDLQRAVSAGVDKDGVAVVRGGLDRATVLALAAVLIAGERAARCAPGASAGGGAGGTAPVPSAPAAEAAAGAGAAKVAPAPVSPTDGRWHWPVHLWPEGAAALRACGLELAWRGLLLSRAGTQAARLRLSELQLVVSEPGSADQPWHADNASGGLTVIVPLADQTAAMGPTQVIPGSHALHPSAWPSQRHSAGSATAATASASGDAAAPWWPRQLFGSAVSLLLGLDPAPDSPLARMRAPVEEPLRAGDVLICDARTLHRGPGNRSRSPRRILVLRYDLMGSPPPGQSQPHSSAIATLGNIAMSRLPPN